MGVLYVDGFDLGDYALRYTTSGSPVTTSTTRFSSGLAMNMAQINRQLSRAIAASATAYVGFALYMTSNGYDGPIVSFYADGGTVLHGGVRVVSSTTWGIYRSGTQLATFTAPAGATWVYVEVSATVHDSTGTITVRLNGTQVATYTGDTRNGGTATTIDRIVLGYIGGSDYAGGLPYIDDLYISDSAFLGDVRVQTSVGTGAGSSTQFTPTSGSNYDCTNDIPDNAANYVASATSGHRDTYAMGNLTANTVLVHAVQLVTHAYKSDAGAASLKGAIKSGATVAYGATTALPTSMGAVTDIWLTNPDTSGAWSLATVDALEAGAEVV